MRIEVETHAGLKREGVFKKFEMVYLVLRIDGGGWHRDVNIPKNGIKRITDLETGEDVTDRMLGRRSKAPAQ